MNNEERDKVMSDEVMNDEEIREAVEHFEHLTYAQIASACGVSEYEVRRVIGLIQ